MTITGTVGNDHLSGTTGDDEFDLTQGGNDRVDGDDGSDTFLFDETLTARDRIDGGFDYDIVALDGDYSGGLRFKGNSLTSVEQFNLSAGHSYDLTFVDANTSVNFILDASTLVAGQSIVIDATRDTDTDFVFRGGAGDDILLGGDGVDTFNQTSGGHDTLRGNDGTDFFNLYGTLGTGDIVDGGAGTDFLNLLGDYSSGLEITKDMMRDVEVLFLSSGFNYDLSLGKHVRGGQLYVDATALGVGNTASFDGSTVKDFHLIFGDGQGDDSFIDGAFGDTIRLKTGGDDQAEGRDGDDTFDMGDALTRGDQIDGGDGYDKVLLDNGGAYFSIDFKNATMTHIEEIDLAAGDSYVLIFADGNVAAGETLLVDGSALLVGESLSLEGHNETDGTFIGIGGANNDVMEGGTGDDTLSGAGGHDSFYGGLGADTLNGGSGPDLFNYYTIEESSGPGHDVLGTFNANFDKIGVTTTVTGVDPTIHGGTLSVGSFDDDLSFAVDGNALGGGHAVIFRPDQGDLAGHIYLVIEFNGGDGYQAGQDWVMEIANGTSLASLSTSNFLHIFP